MSTEKALVATGNDEIIQRLVLDGDISKMNQMQRVQYYKQFCESLGLNPLTQPFAIIKFQGKEKLYALKDCTEQLRKIHGVSITDISAINLTGVYMVTAKAQDKTGKTDVDTGLVNVEGLKGEALCNAIMKATTKAKRRVTLSICGLGMLDESETDTMPGAQMAPPPPEIKVDAKFLITYTALEDIDKVLIMANTVADLSTLYNSNKELVEANPELKQRFTNAQNLIVPPVSIVSYEDLAELFEVKKEACNSELRGNAERILTNREVSSYSKLHKTLSSL